jgi:alpha-beta hydrolase superfamily lysophospholipase
VGFDTRMQNLMFTAAVTVISRAFVLRDRLLGRMKRERADAFEQPAQRCSIPSGSTRLDAVFVAPDGPPQAALLICHGIGEIVDHWQGVQQLLATRGIASLVFDYAGYGKSGGMVDWKQCEDDAVAAFAFLEKSAGGVPLSILGFSMGSGIAAAIRSRIHAERLILCAAFTSFRDAVCALGMPRSLCWMVAPIWSGEASLRGCAERVLVMHGGQDRVFPVRMAAELGKWCGDDAEVIIVPDQKHNEPFYRPKLSYWEHVVARLVREVPLRT